MKVSDVVMGFLGGAAEKYSENQKAKAALQQALQLKDMENQYQMDLADNRYQQDLSLWRQKDASEDLRDQRRRRYDQQEFDTTSRLKQRELDQTGAYHNAMVGASNRQADAAMLSAQNRGEAALLSQQLGLTRAENDKFKSGETQRNNNLRSLIDLFEEKRGRLDALTRQFSSRPYVDAKMELQKKWTGGRDSLFYPTKSTVDLLKSDLDEYTSGEGELDTLKSELSQLEKQIMALQTPRSAPTGADSTVDSILQGGYLRGQPTTQSSSPAGTQTLQQLIDSLPDAGGNRPESLPDGPQTLFFGNQRRQKNG